MSLQYVFLKGSIETTLVKYKKALKIYLKKIKLKNC